LKAIDEARKSLEETTSGAERQLLQVFRLLTDLAGSEMVQCVHEDGSGTSHQAELLKMMTHKILQQGHKSRERGWAHQNNTIVLYSSLPGNTTHGTCTLDFNNDSCYLHLKVDGLE